jgi:hypothetical protein
MIDFDEQPAEEYLADSREHWRPWRTACWSWSWAERRSMRNW